MIAKYRNRSAIYLVGAILLTVGLVLISRYLLRTRFTERRDGLGGIAIFGYVAAWVMWILVGFNLARAKGYSRDFVGTMFLFVYIFGFCMPLVVMLFPIYILVAMEDKTKNRMRRHWDK